MLMPLGRPEEGILADAVLYIFVPVALLMPPVLDYEKFLDIIEV